MIDTHCHLTFPEFEGQTDAVMARAADAGVVGAISISTTTEDAPRALAVAKRHDRVWCTAGVHPLYSDQGPHDWAALRVVASDPECVAWGELGLDNHYDEPPRDMQHAVLAEQLAFIESCERDGLSLPIVLHCRKAFTDLVPILRESSLDASRMVFHCFTGDADDARLALDLGAMISFTGVVTYKNAAEVREAAKLVPADRIMCETDAPFLSPEPKRGVRPCEPAFASFTAKFLAELREQSWPEFHDTIDANTERFFGIEARALRAAHESAAGGAS
ncbi:MAG: TatD family hydrolase [Planctomycetota bacterium]